MERKAKHLSKKVAVVENREHVKSQFLGYNEARRENRKNNPEPVEAKVNDLDDDLFSAFRL